MATVNVLVVAGGGGGGSLGGGGGAGGYQADGAFAITSSAYAVVVGAGGAGASSGSPGSSGTAGSDSSFSTITANGGGAGGHGAGGNGGSGGGAQSGSLGTTAGGTASQGHAGGSVTVTSTSCAGAGGGGNGSAGASLTDNQTGGAGGSGTANSISGSSLTYAAGGGGGGRNGNAGGAAGASTAGAGGNYDNSVPPTAGTANFGGGGGGGGFDGSTNFWAGAAGGSGVVIIAYPTGSISATGGTITTSGGNTIHTFTSNGTFTASVTTPVALTTTPLVTVTTVGRSKTYLQALTTTALVTVATLTRLRTVKKALTTTPLVTVATVTSVLPPTPADVIPSSAGLSGGVSVTLTGVRFSATPTVTVGGTSATNVVFVSATEITFTVPAHAAGVVDIVVTNPDTLAGTLHSGFTYYTAPNTVRVTLDGVDIRMRVRMSPLSIRDVLNDAPNTVSLVLDGTPAPTADQRLKITLDAETPAEVLFAGPVESVDLSYVALHSQWVYTLHATDDLATLNKLRPFGTWTNISATTIAQEVLAVVGAGFSSAHIEAALPAVSITADGTETSAAFFKRLATMVGGYFYVEDLALHFFTAEATGSPLPVDATHPPIQGDIKVTMSTDDSQLRTRVYGKGAAATITADVNAAETLLPIDDATNFDAAGGSVILGQTAGGAQSEIATFAATQIGGFGTLVGPGAAPSAAPGVSLVAGAGIDDGVHKYAYTDVTAAGESLPSPLATITTGPVTVPIANPSSTPTPGTPLAGGNGADPGVHYYGWTCIDALGGETLPSPLSAAFTSRDVTAPTANGFFLNIGGGSVPYSIGDTIDVVVTYVNSSGEAPQSVASGLVIPSWFGFARVYNFDSFADSADSTVTSKRVYLRVNGGTWHWDAIAPGTSQYTFDHVPTTTGSPPGSNTAYVRQVVVTVPLGPTGTSDRKLYRTVAGGSSLLQVGASIGDNSTTTKFDNVVDASLGASAPGTNTTAVTTNYRQTALTGIAIGASGTTSRWIYRTAAGASQLKRLHQLADNSTTTWADSAADSSLGANAPTVDTSGLTMGTGQVIAGSTTLLSSGVGGFPSAGWLIAPHGLIRYSGLSGNTFTGIPATGSGSITTTLIYGSQIAASPMLTGINVSAGIVLAIANGSSAAIWVQRDDVVAQGRYGIIHNTIVDGRRTKASLTTLCDADLALFAAPIVTVVYPTRDVRTKSGKTVSVNLASPPIGPFDLVIQDVTIDQIDIAGNRGGADGRLPPRFAVTASNVRFSLDDTIRRLIAGQQAIG